MPCKWVSLSIGALSGKLEGVRLRDFSEKRKSIFGFNNNYTKMIGYSMDYFELA
jgi:hypothetical protein